MDIVAGMILMCTMLTNFTHGNSKLFIHNVETKVHHITPKGDAFIQYNLKKHKALVHNGDEDLFDIVSIGDMKRANNMNCKEMQK